jgi:hypothetical protein
MPAGTMAPANRFTCAGRYATTRHKNISVSVKVFSFWYFSISPVQAIMSPKMIQYDNMILVFILTIAYEQEYHHNFQITKQ